MQTAANAVAGGDEIDRLFLKRFHLTRFSLPFPPAWIPATLPTVGCVGISAVIKLSAPDPAEPLSGVCLLR